MAQLKTLACGIPVGVNFATLRREFVKEFCAADKDQSAKLDRKEFLQCLKKWGMESCDFLFDMADTDRSGTIDIKEFLALCEAMHKAANSDDLTGFLTLAFKAADWTGRGQLDFAGFNKFMRYIGLEGPDRLRQVEETFAELDTDQSKTISLEEIMNKVHFVLRPAE